MFQRPPQRRTLNTVNSNSTYLNHQGGPSSPMDVGYGDSGMANSNGNMYSSSNNRRSNNNTKGGGRRGIPCGFFFFWTALLIAGPYLYYEYWIMPDLILSDGSKEEVERTRHHWMTKYHKLQVQHEALEKSQRDLKLKTDGLLEDLATARQNNGGNSAQEEELRKQLQETTDTMNQERGWLQEWRQLAEHSEQSEEELKRTIQEIARRDLTQKYGWGPYAVEFEVNFGEGENNSGWITVELASADEMPHTVYTFLEQVDKGLYNDGGYAFHHNAIHVVQGGPIRNHLTPFDIDPSEKFQNSGVANVLYQEYSDNFRHAPYTLGFSGRPSGPNFYFNVQDNSNLHGPGGYAEDGSADPCFGRVTRGHEVIDRMHQLDGGVQPGEWKELNPFVAVRWVRIM